MQDKVLVIGGGPAGATAAALLAKEGFSVRLLERSFFPRYHIGESLASSCHEFLSMSGALFTVESSGFVLKRGGLLRWEAGDDLILDWCGLFGAAPTWQVDRDEFDKVLLDHAASVGVEVIQGAKVTKVLFDGDRPYAAEWTQTRSADSTEEARGTTEFDYLVDASGRAGLLSAQQFKNRRKHEAFRNVAIWGYWAGGDLLPDTPEGGINQIADADGWFWVIPLRGGRVSVGKVTDERSFAARRGGFDSVEAMLHGVIAESEAVSGLLTGATFQQPVHVERDYSYVADSFCGPGYYLAGDAACFLDPLLSTGVHLAMYSATLAAAAITATAHGDVSDRQARSFYESMYHDDYTRMFLLASDLYSRHPATDGAFWSAQRPPVHSQLLGPDSGRALPTLEEVPADISTGDYVNIRFSPFPVAWQDPITGLGLVTTPRLGLAQAADGQTRS